MLEPGQVWTVEPGLIQFVQAELKVQSQDGTWDEPTRAAVQRFCTERGLAADRPLDGKTLPRRLFQILIQEENR